MKLGAIVPSPDELDNSLTGHNFTMCVWTKIPTDISEGVYKLGYFELGTGGGFSETVLPGSPGMLSYQITDVDNASYFSIGDAFTIDEWVHRCYAHNYDTFENILYINGFSVGFDVSDRPLESRGESRDRGFVTDGWVGAGANPLIVHNDEFYAWNRVLSPDEISEVYLNNIDGKIYPFITPEPAPVTGDLGANLNSCSAAYGVFASFGVLIFLPLGFLMLFIKGDKKTHLASQMMGIIMFLIAIVFVLTAIAGC
jgi:hypothetical protein